MILLAGCVTTSDIGNSSKEITESESDLVFNGPGVENGYRKIISGYAGNHYTHQTLAFYGPVRGQYPYANIVLLETSEINRYFPKEQLDDALEGWTAYAENTPEIGTEYSTPNDLGVVKYAAFEDGDAKCLVFSEVFGTHIDRGARNLISGHYCRLGASSISEAEGAKIVKAISHRDYGAVPSSEAREARNARIGLALEDMSGQYIFDWPELVSSQRTKITFVGQESGAFFFKTDELGHCDGDYDVTDFGNEAISGMWKLTCGDHKAAGTFSKGADNSGVEIRADGQDEDGRLVSFAK